MDKQALERLYFPFSQVRDHQDKLILDIEKGLEKGKNMVIHAPTGLGKTVASLAPCIKYAIENNLTVYFLTPRHTQHMIALKTIKAIKEKFPEFFKWTVQRKLHLNKPYAEAVGKRQEKKKALPKGAYLGEVTEKKGSSLFANEVTSLESLWMNSRVLRRFFHDNNNWGVSMYDGVLVSEHHFRRMEEIMIEEFEQLYKLKPSVKNKLLNEIPLTKTDNK